MYPSCTFESEASELLDIETKDLKNISALIQYSYLGFEIAIDDVQIVQVRERQYNFSCVQLSLVVRKSAGKVTDGLR